MRKVVVAMIAFLCIAAIFCGCSREFCEVSYISEGKEFFKTRVEKGGALRLPDEVSTKEADGENEYEFKGWSDKENGDLRAAVFIILRACPQAGAERGCAPAFLRRLFPKRSQTGVARSLCPRIRIYARLRQQIGKAADGQKVFRAFMRISHAARRGTFVLVGHERRGYRVRDRL